MWSTQRIRSNQTNSIESSWFCFLRPHCCSKAFLVDLFYSRLFVDTAVDCDVSNNSHWFHSNCSSFWWIFLRFFCWFIYFSQSKFYLIKIFFKLSCWFTLNNWPLRFKCTLSFSNDRNHFFVSFIFSSLFLLKETLIF
jgi:hypothetical protein